MIWIATEMYSIKFCCVTGLVSVALMTYGKQQRKRNIADKSDIVEVVYYYLIYQSTSNSNELLQKPN